MFGKRFDKAKIKRRFSEDLWNQDFTKKKKQIKAKFTKGLTNHEAKIQQSFI